MREDQARILDCPQCGAVASKPCLVESGVRLGKSRSTAHAARVKAVATFISDAYCQNESVAGYSCGRPECPHCGGVGIGGKS